jgi:hypothetical protein
MLRLDGVSLRPNKRVGRAGTIPGAAGLKETSKEVRMFLRSGDEALQQFARESVRRRLRPAFG